MRYLPLLAILLSTSALADPRTDCPPPATSCKVITLSADEEKALLDPRMLLETAVQARQLDMLPIANYFRDKIARAPSGDTPKPPEPPAK